MKYQPHLLPGFKDDCQRVEKALLTGYSDVHEEELKKLKEEVIPRCDKDKARNNYKGQHKRDKAYTLDCLKSLVHRLERKVSAKDKAMDKAVKAERDRRDIERYSTGIPEEELREIEESLVQT
ncbi:MAG: hypothetical protein LBG75_03580 [Candidatus Nomurabacteria bacterium]|jgi:hypothetical protein|nr:hypothetical protein [Candidatus Nomurabacteria bacterium]